MLPPEVGLAVGRLLAAVPLNRYPDLEARGLKRAWAARLGVDVDQLVLGNGSDELIGLLVRAFDRPRPPATVARVAVPVPSFPMFRAIALAHGAEVVDVPLGPGFELDADVLDRVMSTARPNVLFLDRPSNPTGALWPRDLIERTAAAHPECAVVVDEACADYAGQSMVDAVTRLPTLIVLRSLSKLGLAALRVGAVVAHRDVAAAIDKGRLPFNVDAYAQLAAAYVLETQAARLSQHVQAVVDERERMSAELRGRPGVRVHPSRANFILLGLPRAEAIWQALLERGVLVQRLSAPPVQSCVRVTVGTREENDRFLDALDQSLRLHS